MQLNVVDENGDAQLFEGTHTLRVSQGSGTMFSREFTVAKTELIRKLEW